MISLSLGLFPTVLVRKLLSHNYSMLNPCSQPKDSSPLDQHMPSTSRRFLNLITHSITPDFICSYKEKTSLSTNDCSAKDLFPKLRFIIECYKQIKLSKLLFHTYNKSSGRLEMQRIYYKNNL